MSLADWRRNGWLITHESNSAEISDLLQAADRDLRDSQSSDLSPDWRLAIAHNAAMMCATAALAASGYRAAREGHHRLALQSLEYTVGLEEHTLARLDTFRKKRNLSGYQRAGAVQDSEAQEMISLAERLRREVEDWLRADHPHLLPGKEPPQ
jgi:hypothetical protein